MMKVETVLLSPELNVLTLSHFFNCHVLEALYSHFVCNVEYIKFALEEVVVV